MGTKRGKWILVLVMIVLVAAFFLSGAHRYLTFEQLKHQREAILQYYESHQLLTIGLFFATYVLVTALSLPGAVPLTLTAGFLFGLGLGTLVVSFASTTGATLAFLASRYLLRDWVRDRFGARLHKINDRFAREGSFYLFTLRLIPVVPFFVINLVMGLLPIRVGTFYLVSQIGMLAGTAVYVNAGTQLSQISSLSGLLSLELLLSFALIGVFPLAAKKAIEWLRLKRGRPARPDIEG
jgi:uncharacterized membrane protein YdjX (TVP38/TMEM64 family)